MNTNIVFNTLIVYNTTYVNTYISASVTPARKLIWLKNCEFTKPSYSLYFIRDHPITKYIEFGHVTENELITRYMQFTTIEIGEFIPG